MILNAIKDIWGYDCFYDGVDYFLIDSNGVTRVPTEAEYVEINEWISNAQETQSKSTLPEYITNVIYLNENPTISTNPISVNMSAINLITGETFNCINNTIDNNIWIGQLNTIVMPIPEANIFDFYGDNSTVAFYKFNNNAKDSGGLYNGIATDIKYVKHGEEYSIHSARKSTIAIKGLPFDNTTEVVTICCWINWNGKSSRMPFGFSDNTIYISKYHGINTGNGDSKGIPKNEAIKLFKNKWTYHIVTFKKGAYGTINIDGVDLELTELSGNIGKALFTDRFNIFGWPSSSSYRDFGDIARLRIINRELSVNEKQLMYLAENKAYGELL